MSQFVQDVRLAVRSLLKRPAFTSVAVLTLALGAGLTTAIFSVVYGVLLRPLPYNDSDRIVMLWQTQRDNPQPSPGGSTSHLNFLDWRRQSRSFEAMALYSGSRFVLTGIGEAEVVRGAIVTPGFFEAFGAPPVRGRSFTDADDAPNGPRVVIVSHGFWMERLGGRPDALGSTLELSGRAFEVVGIAPPGFDFPRQARFWRPVQNNDQNCGRDCVYTDGIAKLRPGVSVEAARSEMDAIARRLEADYPDANTNLAIGVVSLKDATVGNVRPALRILMGAVVVVLLIACANVANLLLARGAARQTEIAVRAALGASRGRLMRQMTVESLVLAAMGAALGLLFATWAVDLVKQLAPEGIPRLDEIGLDPTTFVFAMSLVAFTAAIFGLGPSLQLVRVPLVESLREGSKGTMGVPGTGRAKFALLVGEVALSLVLLVGAGLLLRSFSKLQSIDPGYRPDGIAVFTISLPPSRYADDAAMHAGFEDLDRRLSAIPGVHRVGRIQGLPLGPSVNVLNFRRADRPPPPPGQSPAALYRSIDPDYLSLMGIPIVAGRDFTDADREGSLPVIIIGRETARRYWPGEDALGKRLTVDGPERTIVGIVGDVRSEYFAAPPQPEMYLPHLQSSDRSLTMVLRTDRDPAQILTEARTVVQAFDPKLPLIGPGTMQQLVDDAVAQPRFYLLLASLFAMLAVVLAAVGVYGVVAYLVSQRTREIGVRMALGARSGEVVGLVLWAGLKPALIGCAIGVALAISGAGVIRSLLYDVAPRDTATVLLVTALLLVTVLVACVIPATRATRIPPSQALRAE